MISDRLLALVRCPACAGSLATQESPQPRVVGNSPEPIRDGGGALSYARNAAPTTYTGSVRCGACGRDYPLPEEKAYLDLRPPEGTFSDLTAYAEEEFHHRPGPLRPPFLSAGVKIDLARDFLALTPQDRVLDIGCGNGRAVFFMRTACREIVGIDAGAHFAGEAAASVDLLRGDVRKLPLATGCFDKAFSLDVLEHLSEDGVRAMLSEARRVLRPGGRFFLYSHVMMSSRLASFQRGVNHLVQWLDARGVVDNAPERARKSDHVNAIRSYEQLDSILAATGFSIEKIRYYNVFFKAVIEDLLLPLAEHNLFRGRTKAASSGSWRGASSPSSDGAPPPSQSSSGLPPRPMGSGLSGNGHAPSGERPAPGRWTHGPLAVATALMKLDVLLFGRIRTGPFFLLLRAE